MIKRLPAIAVVMSICLLMLLAGCQSATTGTEGVPTQAIPSVPYSKGPSGPPQVKGPTGPPPVSVSSTTQQNGPQAVTETDKVRYELPQTPTVQVMK